MKKEEIKKDYIYEKIMDFINYASSNQKKFWYSILSIFTILIVFVIYSNNIEKSRMSNNAYISTHQNNFIDDKKELALIGFENILENSTKSEAYNQAFIYVLSNAVDENDNDKIRDLLNKYKSDFETDDTFLNSMLFKLIADHYISINDNDRAISYYKMAISECENDDYLSKYKLSLINLYLSANNIDAANAVFNNIVEDDLSYENKNKFEVFKSKLTYRSK